MESLQELPPLEGRGVGDREEVGAFGVELRGEAVGDVAELHEEGAREDRFETLVPLSRDGIPAAVAGDWYEELKAREKISGGDFG